MPKVALYMGAAVFALLAAAQGVLYLMEVDVVIGGSLFRSVNILGGAILFTLLAVWMIIASLDTRADR